MQEIIKEYTNGLTDTAHELCCYTQYMHGSRGMWDTAASEDHLSFVAAHLDESVRDDFEALYSKIMTTGKTVGLVRTEINKKGNGRIGKRPEVGEKISWGVKSASALPDWADQVISGDAEGISIAHEGDEIIVFHIESATRYLDIARFSEWDQGEYLIAGDYEVINIEVEEAESCETYYRDEHLTPKEQAEKEGVEPEWFISKRGNEMVRYGTHVYHADKWEKPIVTIYHQPYRATIPVVHVYLKEI